MKSPEHESYKTGLSARTERLADNTERKKRIAEMWTIFEEGFSDTPFVNPQKSWLEIIDGKITNPTLHKMQQMLLKLAPMMQDRIDEHYIDHLAYTACLGETIEQQLREKGIHTGYESGEVAPLFLVHDLTTMITGHYARKDIYFDILWKKLSLGLDLKEKLDPVLKILGMTSQDTQLNLSLAQHIHDYSDNLGKFKGNKPRGKLKTPPLNEKTFIPFIEDRMKQYKNNSNSSAVPIALYPSTTKALRQRDIHGKGAYSIELILQSKQKLDQDVDLKLARRQAIQQMTSGEMSKWRRRMKHLRKMTLKQREQNNPDVLNPTISGYLFDVGGTLLSGTTDEDLAHAIATQLNADYEEILAYIQHNAGEYTDKYDDSSLIFGLYDYLKIEKPKTIDEARNAWIHPDMYTVIPDMQQLVTDAVKQGKRIGGFSNCIATLIPVVKKAILKYYPNFPVENILFSAEVGIKKSSGNTEPYSQAAKKLYLPTERCIFFDDIFAYREDARKTGMLAMSPF